MQMEKMDMEKRDQFPALTFIGIGVIALIALSKLPFGNVREPDTSFFPVLLSVLLIILSLALLWKSVASRVVPQGRFWEERWKKLIPAIAALAVYAFLLKPVGYVVCTFFILILFAKIEKCSWKAAFLVSVFCTFFSYSLFRWYLQSPLPQGILPF